MFGGGEGDDAELGGEPVVDVAAASDDELFARALKIERERTGLDAEEAGVLAELEVRVACSREHGLSTGTWLAREANLSVLTARRRVSVASGLRRRLPLVADALGAGTIGWEHARVLVELINPRIAEIVVENQVMLLALADRCRFEQWRAEVQALARLWDQDGAYDPSEDEASNTLSFGRTLDGLTSLTGTLTGGNGEAVTRAIDAKADELFRQASEDHKVTPDLVVPSRRTLRAQALVVLVRQALGVDLESSKPAKPEVTLVVGADDPGSVLDSDGVPLADGTTRTLLCGADLHALVVDSLGVPLDMGRRVRLATDAQRRAVRSRDGGCAFPGCGSKALWCDVHHCVHWDGEGGVTDICNLVCLCRHHHGVVHRRGWRIWLDADGWAAFRTASGVTFWGQRHGRQREGPPPDPPAQLDDGDAHKTSDGGRCGAVVAPGRFHRIEDPLVNAEARQLVLARLATRPTAA